MSDIDNGQHWLDRNRPPRVQITYDVEIGDAVEKKELPLVVGILAHLDRRDDVVLGKKRFEPIDRDNFNELLKGMAPTIMLKATGATLTVTNMEHFHPLGLLNHPDLPELSARFQERQQLRDMLAKLDGNERMETMLKTAINSSGDGDAAVDPKEKAATDLTGAVTMARGATDELSATMSKSRRSDEALVATLAAQSAAVLAKSDADLVVTAALAEAAKLKAAAGKAEAPTTSDGAREEGLQLQLAVAAGKKVTEALAKQEQAAEAVAAAALVVVAATAKAAADKQAAVDASTKATGDADQLKTAAEAFKTANPPAVT
jgi:type VI secretion system protein ImpB